MQVLSKEMENLNALLGALSNEFYGTLTPSMQNLVDRCVADNKAIYARKTASNAKTYGMIKEKRKADKNYARTPYDKKYGYIVECITIYTTPDIVTYTGVIYANEQDAVEECAEALNDPDIIDAWVQKVRKNNARND